MNWSWKPPLRQALHREGQGCVPRRTKDVEEKIRVLGDLVSDPGGEYGLGQSCPEHGSIILSEWFWHCQCKWPLNILN